MLTRQDVTAAYRLLLGREPESDEVIEKWIEIAESTYFLVRAITGSEEFASRMNVPATRMPRVPYDAPHISVQSMATDAELLVLFERIKTQWSRLGAREPHWSVLVHDQFKAENIHESIDLFYQSGELSLRYIESSIEKHIPDKSSLRSCFELGCGVGRITLHLSKKFDHVVAADISENHLSLARSKMEAEKVSNVSLLTLRDIRDLESITGYDVFCSLIVFQHNPPPVIRWMLKTILNNLNEGGVAVFQLPSYHKEYKFILSDYLRTGYRSCVAYGGEDMDMHVLPQKDVFDICLETGCRILEIREDQMAVYPTEGTSNTYVLQKQRISGKTMPLAASLMSTEQDSRITT